MGRNRYVFVIIDYHTRYMWTMLLKEKSEAFGRFKKLKASIEQETCITIKTLRTDRGGEFTSLEFNSFYEENGIQRHLTAPYSPQQNGVVERRNRTILEMTGSVLKHMSVPNYMWREAVRHVTYLVNRSATRTLAYKTPYEMFKGSKANISHLKVFGCIGYARTKAPRRKKAGRQVTSSVAPRNRTRHQGLPIVRSNEKKDHCESRRCFLGGRRLELE